MATFAGVGIVNVNGRELVVPDLAGHDHVCLQGRLAARHHFEGCGQLGGASGRVCDPDCVDTGRDGAGGEGGGDALEGVDGTVLAG